jgi:hypothetical protein
LLSDRLDVSPFHLQNKEPLHMLRLFQGRFIVHEGGNPSSFRNVSEEEHVSDGTGLYHIRGSNEFNTRAVQVGRERGWEGGRGGRERQGEAVRGRKGQRARVRERASSCRV